MGFYLGVSSFGRKQLRRFFFLLIILGLIVPFQVRADMTLGALKGQHSLPTSKHQAEQFAAWLEQQLGEPVKVRIFSSPTLLHQWMNRYREVDLGLLPIKFVRRYHAIEFQQLIIYEPETNSNLTTVLAGRRGLPGTKVQQLRDLLLTMDTDPDGMALLRAMGIAAYMAPGSDRVVLRSSEHKKKPARIVRRKEAEPPKATSNAMATTINSVVTKPAPIQASKVAEPKQTQDIDQANIPTEAKAPPKAPAAEIKQGTVTARQQMAPSTLPTAPVLAPEKKPQETGAKTSKTGPPNQTPQTDTAKRSRYSRTESPRSQIDQEKFSGKGKIYLFLITAILAAGGALKLWLILNRRSEKRPAATMAQVVMQHDWSALHQKNASETGRMPEPDPGKKQQQPPQEQEAGETPAFAADNARASQTENPHTQPDAEDSLAPLLKPPVKIPIVLARIDQEKLSGTLVITAPHNEKVLEFIRGQLTSASSRNLSTKAQSGFLMNKLGYLLVRQGKITEEDRDRALVLCEGNPSLRLGEALIELGVLKRSDLLRTLQDQAKMILHSLIVFPEGDFHFEPGIPPVSPEDNLRLSISDFLREAAAHEHEWDNIRSMIPSLDTILAFAPGGRDKVSSGRLTVHQKFVLSLVDGQRRIRDICTAATMLDYELYRFLYLMVKADILQRIDMADDSPAA